MKRGSRSASGARSAAKPAAAASAPVTTATAPVANAATAMRVGRLLAGSTVGKLVVDYAGSPNGPLPARSALALDADTLARAVATGRGAVLLFENGDPALPVVIGLLDESAGAALLGDLLVRPAPAEAKVPANAAAAPTPAAARSTALEARLDGKRVVLEGKEEVVLRCGEASITLRRDGKVVVRGAYVETHAQGINRIKGGAVKIN